MSEHPSQRREFSRVDVRLRTEVDADGQVHRDGTIENLSLKGGFFRTPSPLPDGTPVRVRLHLEGTGVEVHAHGHVIRHAPDGCAIQFDEIVGLDSLDHLRNLVRFNATNPAQVEREFDAHLGLRRDA